MNTLGKLSPEEVANLILVLFCSLQITATARWCPRCLHRPFRAPPSPLSAPALSTPSLTGEMVSTVRHNTLSVVIIDIIVVMLWLSSLAVDCRLPVFGYVKSWGFHLGFQRCPNRKTSRFFNLVAKLGHVTWDIQLMLKTLTSVLSYFATNRNVLPVLLG